MARVLITGAGCGIGGGPRGGLRPPGPRLERCLPLGAVTLGQGADSAPGNP
jgi:hypothetical protein